MNVVTALLKAAERIPFERLFVKPPSNKKKLEALKGILEEAHAAPAEAPPDNLPEEVPDEYENLKGYLEPRQQKVHLEPPPANGVSVEGTVAYQNREIGKLLLRMERHYAQRLRINGIPCDCGSQKHLLDMESLCEETISMVDNPDVYYRILAWVKKVGPKSTDQAAKSGQHDDEYPIFSREARDFRKELTGSLEPSAMFYKKEEKQAETSQPEEVTELPLTEAERKDILSRGIVI